jgi:hypothetical protein
VQKQVFYVKRLHGAHFSIARDIRVVVGHRLHTTYHMPYVPASYVGIHVATSGVPPNLLETDRI